MVVAIGVMCFVWNYMLKEVGIDETGSGIEISVGGGALRKTLLIINIINHALPRSLDMRYLPLLYPIRFRHLANRL